MPRVYKIRLRSNVPLRLVGRRGWGLGDELGYYGVSQAAFGRFVGVTEVTVGKWVRGGTVPHSVVLLMGLLSQFPPVWVRNRLTGEVRLDEGMNGSRQPGFYDGSGDVDGV